MRILVLLLLLTLPAAAATLRPFTTVERSVVRLSDLWDGVAKDRDLGPAPAPGARILVEAPQLAAIARQFGVDWEPASPGDRAIVERAGQPLSREAVLAAVRAALAAAGAPADADVEVPAFAAPIVPMEGGAEPSISQLAYDAGTGEFTALVSVAAAGMTPAQSRVAGRVVPTQELPVPTRAIGTGEVLGAADMRVIRVRAAGLAGEAVHSAAQAVGLAPRRPLAKGQPILLADLERPVLVRRGASVTMALAMPGLALTAEGIAMAPATMGERIRVLNPSSKMLVEA
ncbi:MAG: flagellar basal body P-ring formation protein FlgA, partial [Acetobacteraceae bacterium]|nr:flagellar basal body P-ring formation protein FlgA [Acetobacteraceae bacterium]